MSFNSWQSFWNFSEKISHDTRYIYDSETIEFIDEVIKTSESRVKAFLKGRNFCRAQIGSVTQTIYDDENIEIGEKRYPHPPERMFPLPFSAGEGRVNPKGIPYLYLATDWETAMSECRPWVGLEISVGKFTINRNLKIVDCSQNHSSNPIFFDIKKGIYEPEASEREKAVWAHIGNAFSTPVNHSEAHAHYAPTQIIAEAFKKHGYDGIAYKSMLGKGFNIALFNINDADLMKSHLFEVKNVNFEFNQTG